MASQRGSVKSCSSREAMRERRRSQMLKRQKKDRMNYRDHVRKLAESSLQNEEEEGDIKFQSTLFGDGGGFGGEQSLAFGGMQAQGKGGSQKPRNTGKNKGSKMKADVDPEAEARRKAKKQAHLRRRREFFARQLMYPEWLIETPSDLATNWYVLPRPEGTRCLVVSSRGKTISRKKSGAILHSFSSVLPSGNAKQRQPDPCVLDCIYQADLQTYFVLDLMCWSGYAVYDSTSEFRHFWVHSKLGEVPIHKTSSLNKFKFAPVPRFDANVEGLKKAYNQKAHGFQLDGLLFLNKHTHYELGPTPLCLVWKDNKTSRFMVDSSDGKNVSRLQTCTLYVSAEGEVKSLENLTVGVLPKNILQVAAAASSASSSSSSSSSGKAIKLGALNKFSIKGISTMEGDQDRVEGLSYLAPGSKARMLPDTWSKIVFQHCARKGQTVSIMDIAKQAAAPLPTLSSNGSSGSNSGPCNNKGGASGGNNNMNRNKTGSRAGGDDWKFNSGGASRADAMES